ncbi:MAG: CHASE2 domain-containing protein [Oryzomonas sp.]|uniref:CHASE2 domain-containing protein n=1 Tax=Oryzomonas sp. TaxID=2855186 RepID=UPI00284D808E|nr:CHASE2 domain-containing protein [Oryzomonas sp.]MDR3580935.1 CHASE2 domain-containing protein [Oryzomonas sp.]
MITAGFLLTVCTTLLFLFEPQFLKQIEFRLYDGMLSGRKLPPKTTTPVMVGIDDESLKAYGQWPWPRYRLARLVHRLCELGADAVALDFLMPEPDRTSPDAIIAERSRDRDLGKSPTIGAPAQTDSNSQELALALGGGRTILGYYFNFSEAEKVNTSELPTLPKGMIVNSTTTDTKEWPQPTGMLRSLPVLTAAAGAEGFTNVHHDVDGVLRRVPLLLQYHGEYFPSLGLGASLLTSPNRTFRIVNNNSETTLIWGKHHIPLDRNGNLLIDFRNGKQAFPYFSAKDILRGTSPIENLRGKIVIIGARARGLGDIHQVSSGQSLNGLEVHAAILDAILSDTFISRPGWAQGAELFTILLLGALSTLLLSQSGVLLSLATVVLGSGGCYLGARALLLSTGTYLSPLMPMVTPVIIVTVLSLLKYGIETRKVLQRNSDLLESQDSIILCMSALTETRDKETGGHIFRTRKYVEILAKQLATSPSCHELDKLNIDLLVKSAPLHDIGKIGIPDRILQKPGRLTEEEFAIIKSHALIGAEALTRTINMSAHPEKMGFLHYAQQITVSHHEKWDGSGYPHGLSGTNIPLSGRIMALADVYDALVSNRRYKSALSHEEVKKMIIKESGKHFDPEIVAAFLANSEAFRHVSEVFADECFSRQVAHNART